MIEILCKCCNTISISLTTIYDFRFCQKVFSLSFLIFLHPTMLTMFPKIHRISWHSWLVMISYLLMDFTERLEPWGFLWYWAILEYLQPNFDLIFFELEVIVQQTLDSGQLALFSMVKQKNRLQVILLGDLEKFIFTTRLMSHRRIGVVLFLCLHWYLY